MQSTLRGRENASCSVVALRGNASDCFRCGGVTSATIRTVKSTRERAAVKKPRPVGRRARGGAKTAGINEFIGRSFNFLAHGQAGEIATFETLFPINRFNNSAAAYTHSPSLLAVLLFAVCVRSAGLRVFATECEFQPRAPPAPSARRELSSKLASPL